MRTGFVTIGKNCLALSPTWKVGSSVRYRNAAGRARALKTNELKVKAKRREKNLAVVT